MLRVVLIAARSTQALELGLDAGWLVDGQLLGDREMQRKMEKRVEGPSIRRIVAVEMLFGVFEQGVVLGVHRNDTHRHLFQPAQWLLRPVLRPSVGEKTASFVASWREHGGSFLLRLITKRRR